MVDAVWAEDTVFSWFLRTLILEFIKSILSTFTFSLFKERISFSLIFDISSLKFSNTFK